MGSAIARQQVQLQKQQNALQQKLKATSSAEKGIEVEAQITALQAQQQTLETEHQEYQQSIHKLSQSIHPFHIETCKPHLGLELPKTLKAPLATLERLSQSHAPNKSQDALERWHKQIPDLSGTLHAWWEWTIQTLKAQTQDSDTQDWVMMVLLP
jgi:seryl-tRNA synthetase